MSNIIKKIKIKKEDGTFTDYIPIGAEANNINVDGESVEAKLNKTPYYYNSVADMKADTKLKVGDMAITLGYYEANDGGAGEYKIVSETYIDDGGSYHELNNGLFAKLIINDYVTPEQFGCYGDGEHDDTQAFVNCLAKTSSGVIIRSNRTKTYIVNEQLTMNGNATLDLGNATIKATDENLDFLIRINDNIGRRKISNITLDCNNLCGGIYVQWATSFTFENVYITNVKTYGIHVYKGSLHIRNMRIINSNNNNATGIFIENGTDSKIEHVTIKNCRRGIDTRDGINFFDTCHIWQGALFEVDNSIAFNIAGASILTKCYADTCQIGYRIVNHNSCIMTDCRCFINPLYKATATLDPYFLYFVNSDSSTIPNAANAENTYLYSFQCIMDMTNTELTSHFSNCDTNDVMQYLPLKKISHNRQPWGLVDYWLTEFDGLTEKFTLSKNQVKIYDEFVEIDVYGTPVSTAEITPGVPVRIAQNFSNLPFTISQLIWLIPITTSTTDISSRGLATVSLSNTLQTKRLEICYIDAVTQHGFRIHQVFSIN